jgi:hypothetical protein
MAYVEFLRIRKALAWHVGILALLTLLIITFAGQTTIDVNGSQRLASGMAVPISILAGIGMFYAAIFGSSAGTSLNRESMTREISWTKPISRTLLALQFVVIDVAGVAIAFAAAMLAVAIAFWRAGFTFTSDSELFAHLALGLGAGVMWYALVLVLTFWFGSGARAVGGILWPVAFLLLGINAVPGFFGAVAHVLNVINPLAYLSGLHFTSASSVDQSIVQATLEVRALEVWVFAALFCAIAVTLWPRKEA